MKYRDAICTVVIGAAACAATMAVTIGVDSGTLSWRFFAVWLCVLAASLAGIGLGKGGKKQ